MFVYNYINADKTTAGRVWRVCRSQVKSPRVLSAQVS